MGYILAWFFLVPKLITCSLSLSIPSRVKTPMPGSGTTKDGNFPFSCDEVNMHRDRKYATSIDDFMELCGIGPELVEFVDEFIQSPERYLSMTPEKRRDIENQMDAITSAFEH